MNKEPISDSLLFGHSTFHGNRVADSWLRMAYNAYSRLQGFRDQRRINKNYAYGRQYSKMMVYNGRKMTKEQYLKEKGIPVLQTNLLGKIKRVIQGQFRMNDTDPVCTAPDPAEKEYAEILSELLKKNMALNDRTEIDARQFEEFIISGLPVYKVAYAYRDGKLDVFTDYVNPNFVFFPDDLDFKLRNIRFCGMLHDLDFSDVLAKFSHSDDDDERLRKIYNHCMEREYLAAQYSIDMRSFDMADTDFFYPREYGKCRVIELWTKERRKAWFCNDPQSGESYFVPYEQEDMIKNMNASRLELNIKRNPDNSPMIDELGNPLLFQDADKFAQENLITYERRIETYWYFRYLSPDGYILEEGQSPYWDGAESFHPFVFKPYPYIDGEIHPFVAEMIPSQEYFNYYMIALDFYIRNASKGVLLMDDQSFSSEMPDPEDVAENYLRTDGVVIWSSKKGGKAPTTVSGSSIPGGFDYFIQMSRSLIDDVSGAQAAMQGKASGAGVGYYQAQIAQANSSILDLLRSFNSFLTDVAYRVVKVMKCCYTGSKTITIAGRTLPVNLDTLTNIDIDVTISESTNSPLYRTLTNEFLLNSVKAGDITMRVALEAGDFYNSEKIIAMLDKAESIKQQQAAMAQQAPAPAQ